MGILKAREGGREGGKARGTYRGFAGGASDLDESATEPGVAAVADQVHVHVHLVRRREGGREGGRRRGVSDG
jgi:hypothetical protein